MKNNRLQISTTYTLFPFISLYCVNLGRQGVIGADEDSKYEDREAYEKWLTVTRELTDLIESNYGNS